MSGHSKWSKVKHQKATTDVVKGAAFTKASRAITIAVREGGGVTDPNHNFHLRLAIEKARGVNMPKDNIERAIEKGKGGGGEAIEQMLYEGFVPGGVAVCVEAATDNRQRTVSAIKNIFDRAGGTLSTPGAVSYLFDRCGIITVPKTSNRTLDQMVEVALEAGADDLQETDDMFELYTSPMVLHSVGEKLKGQGIETDNMEIILKPKMTVPIDSTKQASLDNFVEQLEELEDVQKVFTNA